MKVTIIDYNAGNVLSVRHALERLGVEPLISSKPLDIQSADKVIFPGVGEASSTMAWLEKNNLCGAIKSLKQPTLGICLGMQLMCAHSEEGDVECLGIFSTKVKRLMHARKIPHMGWNNLLNCSGPLFWGIEKDSYFYFVHSYAPQESKNSVARCDYEGESFSAALQQDNFFGVQFHPEKSAQVGQKLLENFLCL